MGKDNKKDAQQGRLAEGQVLAETQKQKKPITEKEDANLFPTGPACPNRSN